MSDIQGQMSIFDFPEFLPQEPKQIKENVCSHSNHTCNKEELWKVATDLDDIKCQEVCCRNCNVTGCGARCNGSEEPKPKCEKAFECQQYTSVPKGCEGTVEPCTFGGAFKYENSDWIGSDYLPDIIKSLTEKGFSGQIIGNLKKYSFDKLESYMKPLDDLLFKKKRELWFWSGHSFYKLRRPNEDSNTVLYIIDGANVTIANILAKEIVEEFQEKYSEKLDIPKAPIWNISLSSSYERCPNCKVENRATIYRASRTQGQYGYNEELERCPVCGQLFDWSDEAIEKATKYSKEYLEAEKRATQGEK